jgi:hypothetical protein
MREQTLANVGRGMRSLGAVRINDHLPV